MNANRLKDQRHTSAQCWLISKWIESTCVCLYMSMSMYVVQVAHETRIFSVIGHGMFFFSMDNNDNNHFFS